MYASVTNIVPNLDDRSKISGCILFLSLPLFPPCFFFRFSVNDIFCPLKRQELFAP